MNTHYKGAGNHSVRELETLCENMTEYIYQQQLIKQELVEALQEAKRCLTDRIKIDYTSIDTDELIAEKLANIDIQKFLLYSALEKATPQPVAPSHTVVNELPDMEDEPSNTPIDDSYNQVLSFLNGHGLHNK